MTYNIILRDVHLGVFGVLRSLPVLNIEKIWRKSQGGHLAFIREKWVKFVLKFAMSTLSTLNPIFTLYGKLTKYFLPKQYKKCLQGEQGGHAQEDLK
jgi:hypothetical protein